MWRLRKEIISDLAPCSVDSFVQRWIAATNGPMYRHLINKLTRYPIPDLRLPHVSGQYFLDIGCSWGRWSIAAAQKGYRVVGIDPSVDAISAARRVATQLGLSSSYLVADVRHLPFAENSFDTVFSYSVLQHFDKDSVKLILSQIAHVLKPSGICLIQMANTLGFRNLFNQLRRHFKPPKAFEVRYWTPSELENTFNTFIGPPSLLADGFFSLDAQASDLELLPMSYRWIVRCSETLRQMSEKMRWMTFFADSVYVKGIKKRAV